MSGDNLIYQIQKIAYFLFVINLITRTKITQKAEEIEVRTTDSFIIFSKTLYETILVYKHTILKLNLTL